MTTTTEEASVTQANGALNGTGRRELEALVVQLRAECAEAEAVARHMAGLAARAERDRAAMEATLTVTQQHCTEQLNELRSYRGDELDPLTRALARARWKHPKGCNLASLIEEAGEVGRAINREGLERAREELLDTAVVAIRLYLGETVGPLVPEEP